MQSACPPNRQIWLKELGLEVYTSALAEAGYEDLGYIAEMGLDDATEIEGMKKPNAKQICKAACKLNPACCLVRQPSVGMFSDGKSV